MSLTPGPSPVTWVVQRASSAPGRPGPSRPRPCLLLLLLLQFVAAFLARRVMRFLLLLGTFLLPLNCASPVCCPPKVARTSFMDIFGQCLELGKQARLFWDFNVRDVSAYADVPRRPLVQMHMSYLPS